MDTNNMNTPVPPQGQPPVNPQVPPQDQYVQYVQTAPQSGQPIVPNGQPMAQNGQYVQYGQPIPPNGQYVQYGQPVPPNGQYMPPQQPQQPAPNQSRKLELLLCILSLCLHFIPSMVSGGLAYLIEEISSVKSDASSVIYSIISAIGSAGYIASWVLMIIARVKFKKSTFAKVLMWVYIGILIASVVLIAVIIISCVNALRDCPG